jgi:hypothetical protein
MARQDGWREPEEVPYPEDDEYIYVLSECYGANIACMKGGRPQVWDLQSGSECSDGVGDVVLWRPMPTDWRDLIPNHRFV